MYILSLKKRYMNNRRLSYFFLTTALMSGMTTLSFHATAQDSEDAFRYSQLSTQGTARSIGIGGALGSIGGDFSSLSVNPAGIGVYRSSEFTFTPAIRINSVGTDYTGTDGSRNSFSDNMSRFTVGNIGLVFTSAATGRRYERSKWKSVSFGIGINKVADFNRNYSYSGYNNTSSITEAFVYNANVDPNNAVNFSGTPGSIGYEGYLMAEDTQGYFSVVDFSQGLNQGKIIRERGSMSEFALSLGGNYQEKLLLGVTLGVPFFSFKREMTLQEQDLSGDNNNFFDNFSYSQTLRTKGSGINLKLGAIYKPTDQFRVGLAFHTPTYFSIKDETSHAVTSNTENFKTSLQGSDQNPITSLSTSDFAMNVFEYNLLTPWRAVLSGSAIIGKVGFITADYEYVNYSSARFQYELAYSNREANVNNAIRNAYQGGHILRLGGEARLDLLMLRLGWGYHTNPYKVGGGERMDFSAGAGLRFDNWFLDLGVVHTKYDRNEVPYIIPDLPNIGIPTASLGHSLNNVALTIGLKF